MNHEKRSTRELCGQCGAPVGTTCDEWNAGLVLRSDTPNGRRERQENLGTLRTERQREAEQRAVDDRARLEEWAREHEGKSAVADAILIDRLVQLRQVELPRIARLLRTLSMKGVEDVVERKNLRVELVAIAEELEAL